MATGIAPQDSDVAARAAQIVSTDSPLMRKAAAAGTASANRRGLMNSTMGIGAAQDSVLSAAVPMASQDSAQAAQAENLQKQIAANEGIAAREIESQQTINTANLAAAERERQLSAQVQLSGNYQQAIADTLQNDKIPAHERASVLAAIRSNYQNVILSMQQLYGLT